MSSTESLLGIEIENAKTIINENELMSKMKGEGSFLGLCDYIKENDNNAKWGRKLNIAVIGNSGAGKSSLINALMNLKAYDEGAAKVGVTQTTECAKGYAFPKNPKVMLWDLPGIGTNAMKRKTYVEMQKLEKYDVFLIVTATRFTENDLYLAKVAARLNRYVLFVRTKIDIDLLNAKRDIREDEFDEQVCVESIRDEIIRELEIAQLNTVSRGIYMVSSPEQSKYGFPGLLKMLKMMLMKRSEAIPTVLEIIADKAIKSMCDELQDDMRRESNSSFYAGFFAVPKLESNRLVSKLKNYQEKCIGKFSLDSESLKRASKEIGSKQTTVFPKDVEKLYKEAVQADSHFKQYAKYYLPIVGSAISANNASKIFERCSSKILSDTKKEGETLVAKRIKKLEEDLKACSKI